jgi:hypothetical protein
MNATRLTPARLRQLAAELPDRYTTPLLHLARARLLSGYQLDRLLTDPELSSETAGRVRRRIMTRLTSLGLTATLERRIGGIRAGSAGHIHVLTPAGHTLAAILASQPPPGRIRHYRAPGPMFVNHALDIAEIYVQLTEHSRGGGFRVAAFVTEPGSWWREVGVSLRPDAYTVLAATAYRDCWWLEIDRDTESIPRLQAQFRDYLDHAEAGGTGPDRALPRVLFTAPTQHRCRAIGDLITGLPPPAPEWFAVCTHNQAATRLITALHNQ